MKIPISKYQYNLLTKRNAAAEAAATAARTADLVAHQAADNANQQREALTDVVSCISAEAGQPPADYAGVKFGVNDDGSHFLELMEQPKA
jgi:hypothetical protein